MKKIKAVPIFILSFMLLLVLLLFSQGCKQESAPDYFPMGVGSFWEYNTLAVFPSGINTMSKDIVKVIGTERVEDIECYIIEYYNLDSNVIPVAQYRECIAKTQDEIQCTKRYFPLLSQAYPNQETVIVNIPPEIRLKTQLKEGEAWEWEGMVTIQPQGTTPPESTRQPSSTGTDAQSSGEAETRKPTPPPKMNQIKGKFEYKYLGEEIMNVLNKKSRCIKISVHGESEDGQEIEKVIWYGDKMGKVREEVTLYKGSDTFKTLSELSSFNIDNKEPFKKK